jgi:branched-subunit amino acid ABC-type transport system permease component
MVGYGELARSRPPVANLTTFYLCIAVGGALGGVFNALVAPTIFNLLVEYPVALVLASLIPAFATTQMASSAGTARRQWKWDVLLPLLLVLLICGLIFVDRRAGLPPGPLSAGLIFGVFDVAGKYYLPEIGGFVIYALMVVLLIVFPAGLYGRRT